jgi:O-succinylbenzoate synthase
MRIVLAEAYRYRLKFQQDESGPEPPIPNATSERKGLLLRLAIENGLDAWGDIAPLPGRSQESLADAEVDLVDALSSLSGVQLPTNWSGLCDMNPSRQRCSSVSFGIEQAISGLSACTVGLPVSRWFNDRARKTVEVNALLSGGPDSAMAAARRRQAEGYRAFKLKVGSYEPWELRDLLKKLRQALGKRAELRLDANRAWSFDEAVRQLGDLGDIGISYVEEPLSDPANLEQLGKAISIPIALDETIGELAVDDVEFDRFAFASAAILKPTLIGGMIRTMDVATRFAKLNVEPVLTSTFESEIGLAGLASLAAALSGVGRAAGLDTARYFSNGLLPGQNRLFLPVIDTDDWIQGVQPDTGRLQLLSRARP